MSEAVEQLSILSDHALGEFSHPRAVIRAVVGDGCPSNVIHRSSFAHCASTQDRRLVVLGDGPQHARLLQLADGAPNIRLLGERPREELRDWFRRARAFVFAADEDFGIVPLEAQACGTPVIALGKGGALETVRGAAGADRTGLFFADDTPALIADAVRRFEALDPAPGTSACWANADRFNVARFRADLVAAVDEAWRTRATAPQTTP